MPQKLPSMSFSQPTGGRKLTVRTSLVLTALVSVSLLGALVVEWSSPPSPSTDGTPTSNTLVPVSQATVDPSVVLRRDYGLWGYVATRGTGGLSVDLNYRYNTAADLKDYVVMNDKRISDLAHAGGVVD